MRSWHDAEFESVGVGYHDVLCYYGIGKISGPDKLAETSRHLSNRPGLDLGFFSAEPACCRPVGVVVLICKHPA